MTLQEELDKALVEENALSDTNEERTGGLDISDALKCHRMRYLKYFGYPSKPFDGRAFRSFKMGNLVEDILVGYWRLRGLIVRKAQYFKHYIDPRIKGRTDFTIIKDGKQYVTEMKSYDGFGFWKLKDRDGLNPLHEAQNLNYVDILQNQGEPVEDTGIVVEVSRDTLRVTETPTRSIVEAREELHADWDFLLTAIDNEEIPDVLEDYPSGKSCKWCARKESCKELYNAEKAKNKEKQKE